MDSQRKAMLCVGCGADLEVVGLVASVREAVLFMGCFGESGMKRVSSVGREVDQVRCQACNAVQPARYAEGLVAA